MATVSATQRKTIHFHPRRWACKFLAGSPGLDHMDGCGASGTPWLNEGANLVVGGNLNAASYIWLYIPEVFDLDNSEPITIQADVEVTKIPDSETSAETDAVMNCAIREMRRLIDPSAATEADARSATRFTTALQEYVPLIAAPAGIQMRLGATTSRIIPCSVVLPAGAIKHPDSAIVLEVWFTFTSAVQDALNLVALSLYGTPRVREVW